MESQINPVETKIDNHIANTDIHVTSAQKTAWNAKVDAADVHDATLTIQKNGTAVDTFTANAAADKTINITVPTTAADVGAVAATGQTANKAVITNASGAVTTGTITSAMISDSTIANADIANNTIAKGKLATAVQTSLGLADTALQAADIAGKQDIQIGAAPADGTEAASTDSGKAVVVDDDGRIAMGNKLGSAAYTESNAYAPATHNQASNTINAMTGYTKPNSTGAIAASDSLNAAIGKLEKALDGKQASGDYVPTTTTVNGNALSSNVTLTGANVAVTGYTKPASTGAVAATDTVNAAIGKLEKGLDGKQNLSTADYQMGNVSGGWTTMTAQQQNMLNGKIPVGAETNASSYAPIWVE